MKTFIRRRFHDTISALAYSVASPHAAPGRPDLRTPYNDLTRFILEQHERLPGYLRAPMMIATLAFDVGGFHRRTPQARGGRIAAWRKSRLSFARDLVRYYESLATFALYSRTDSTDEAPMEAAVPTGDVRCKIAVIGSGPGGSLTAALLAETGHDVILCEEGGFLPPESCTPFSMAEMIQKYRHGGQCVTMGATRIAWVEGRCVGGGSEINSGLYHRTPPGVLEHWRRESHVDGLTDSEMQPLFEANESDLSVSPLDGLATAASLRLRDGAESLGWTSVEVPRWFRDGERQSMTRTFIPRFVNAGGRLLARTRVNRLRRKQGTWTLETNRGRVEAETVFVCAGAVQTPALLLRSGIGRNVGRSLRMHPTFKITARFPETVNSATMGVPVHQVKEFSPRLSFGCSISSQAHLALGMLDHPDRVTEVRDEWKRMATYYAMITSEGYGRVSLVPGCHAPLVRYHLTRGDHANLADGLLKLKELLAAAGAVAQYPSSGLMTIHMFSSCPMGEDPSQSTADSFGRVHGSKNLYINDASLLCTAPGVNPQGTIMAIARRNVLHFLGS